MPSHAAGVVPSGARRATADGRANPFRERHPSPIELGPRPSGTSTETDRGTQLLLQSLELRPQAVRSAEIVVPFRFLELRPHLRQALAIGAPRLAVEHLAGIAPDDTNLGLVPLGTRDGRTDSKRRRRTWNAAAGVKELPVSEPRACDGRQSEEGCQ
jgi:hypothetical protein